MKKFLFIIVFFSISILSLSNLNVAQAAISLPDPTETFDGLPIVKPYHDFLSHAPGLYQQFFKFGPDSDPNKVLFADFEQGVNAGTGGIDVLLITGNTGSGNYNIDLDPGSAGGQLYTLEDPYEVKNSDSSFTGEWGGRDASYHGPATVDVLLDYMRDAYGNPKASIPVFAFDMAENSTNLDFKAEFYVWDSVDKIKKQSWFLDDPSRPGNYIEVQYQLNFTGASGTTYTTSMAGSGKADYLVYAPFMDLSLFDDPRYQFRIWADMKNLDGKAEQAFLSGSVEAYVPPKPNPAVPEPATMLLTGAGLAAGLILRRRRRS